MFIYLIVTILALFTTMAHTAPVLLKHIGDATLFKPALGACGIINSPSDMMVAVSFEFFNSFGPQSNGNPVCGRKIRATAPGGNSVTLTIEDKCAACSQFDLDMSPAAFDRLADESIGRLHGVTWHLL
ncbi:barwin-like endoglucanase [Gautieria morchelliformis]|nr:barwin-like endoglucanase [Gautieria morchelliformis]